MIPRACAVALIVIAVACTPPDQQPTLVIENARVIVGDGTVIPNGTVAIAGERIVSVGSGPVDAPDARRIDAAGATALPGLIDAHVHLTLTPENTDSSAVEAFLAGGAREILRGFLEHGVTSVRSTGDFWPWIGRLRDRIAAGHVEGPRIATSGPIVTMRDGHPATTVCAYAFAGYFCRAHLAAEVGSPDEARAAVSRLAAEGVDFIKLVSDSILVPVQIPADVEAATIEQAHAEGLEVVAHVAEAEFMRRAAEQGLDGFVHPTLQPLPPSQARELGAALAAHGTPVTTTTTAAIVYAPPGQPSPFEEGSGTREFLVSIVRGLAAMQEAGVELVLGTDWCGCAPATAQPHLQPGSVTLTEMEILAMGGLATADIIGAATINAARAIGRAADLGTLETGKLADLVIVDGDPLEDIRALRNVQMVVQGGRIVAGEPDAR